MLGTMKILPLRAAPMHGSLGPTPPAQVVEEPKVDNNQVPRSVATHTRTIGIIYPPPEIRNIVDKTAQFVAKKGLELEKRLILDYAGNVKFRFLNASDPYNAYYQHHLAEARARTQPSGEQPTQPADSANKIVATTEEGAEAADQPDPSALFRPVRRVLEPPEGEQHTIRLPEGITGEELHIMKLTAQFVARNGKSFLTGLTNRELNNSQFHFLKPTHSMFMLFTSLTDAYSKVLMPPRGLTNKLLKSAADMTIVLDRCLHRLEWERSQEQARQKAEDEIEQERLRMAMIDWHDFVVVETVDFADDEDQDLPSPMTLEEVIRRSKMPTLEEEEYAEPGKEVEMEMEMDEEEVKLVEEGMRAAAVEENDDVKSDETMPFPDEQDPPMRILKNWKRPEERIPAERDPIKYVVSPITGELIPINEMSEHMRISLIDPKYKEQKERMFAKIRESTLANDDEISRNIVGLAQTRPDIFGTTEEEVSNAVKAEIEEKKEETMKVIWDGHTGSIGRTASHAMSQKSNADDQNDAANDGRNLPGPQAPPPPKPGYPSDRPLASPPGFSVNIPRPPNTLQYSTPTSAGVLATPPPRPPMVNMIPQVWPPTPPMPQMPGQGNLTVNPPPIAVNSHNLLVQPPPGSQFMPLEAPRPFVLFPMSQPGMLMVPPPPMQRIPPPPPVEEAPPLPEEPELKRQKLDESILIPEEQFLAENSGPARINVSVPNTDDGNLKGQVLEISVQSLSETIGSLKEKISGEIQLPSNKQKLSGKAGFLKDNLSLAYYNVASGETLTLSQRERGGRKR